MVKDVHPSNTPSKPSSSIANPGYDEGECLPSSMFVTLLGMEILESCVQKENAPAPISCTPLGMATLCKEEHPLNACRPTFAIVWIVTLFRLVHLEQTLS